MPEHGRFGLLPVRSPLLGESRLFSSPPGTKMFQFPGLASPPSGDGRSSTGRVAPFGHPRVTGRLHLTAAFRSLPRPSSPSRAKASTVRPWFLSLHMKTPKGAYLRFMPYLWPIFQFKTGCKICSEDSLLLKLNLHFFFSCSKMSMNEREAVAVPRTDWLSAHPLPQCGE